MGTVYIIGYKTPESFRSLGIRRGYNKKYILLLLAVVFVSGLVGCKDKPAGTNEKDKVQIQTEPSLLDELPRKIKADKKLL